jgi:hypothetical protein
MFFTIFIGKENLFQHRLEIFFSRKRSALDRRNDYSFFANYSFLDNRYLKLRTAFRSRVKLECHLVLFLFINDDKSKNRIHSIIVLWGVFLSFFFIHSCYTCHIYVWYFPFYHMCLGLFLSIICIWTFPFFLCVSSFHVYYIWWDLSPSSEECFPEMCDRLSYI